MNSPHRCCGNLKENSQSTFKIRTSLQTNERIQYVKSVIMRTSLQTNKKNAKSVIARRQLISHALLWVLIKIYSDDIWFQSKLRKPDINEA
jgi:hypothetical protein